MRLILKELLRHCLEVFLEAFDEVRVESAESLPLLPADERGGRSDEQSGAQRTGAEGGCSRVLVRA